MQGDVGNRHPQLVETPDHIGQHARARYRHTDPTRLPVGRRRAGSEPGEHRPGGLDILGGVTTDDDGQPVATDLRIVVTSLRMSADLERSGDLAQHVAKLARLRYPERAVPHDLHATILEMGQLAQRLMAKAAEVIITKDVDLALQLEQDDDAMDLLHRTLFQHLMDDRWKHGIETAVDVTLLGRYYERFADHAVSVAKRVVYLVTGEHADDLQADIQPATQVEGA